MKISVTRALALDVSHCFGPTWAVSETEVQGAAAEIQKAAAALSAIRTSGAGPCGERVRFTALPNLLADGSLLTDSERARFSVLSSWQGEIDAVVSVGIGGSYLGNRVLWDALSRKESPSARPSVYFAGHTADPEALSVMLSQMKEEAAKKDGAYTVAVLVISKSGTTIEPSAVLSVLQTELPQIAKEVRYIGITGQGDNLLHRQCHENDWLHFYVPEGIGGRFSVLSEVGMVFATLCGFSVSEILQGAADVEAACQSENPKENPAFFLALLKYLATKHHGITTEITMPYSERLRSFAQWYAQLLGESLGKKYDTKGRVVHSGRTAVSAVGTTDMHSVTQEHQEGKPNKLLQFISVEHPDSDWETEIIEDGKTVRVPMSRILRAALSANARALAGEERMSLTIEAKTLDAHTLGALFYFMELAIAYEGALAGVNAYDQPGVEAYKKILHEDLRGAAK